MLAPGTQAPDFQRRDQRGDELSLEAIRARGPVVLYFYPRDFTPICTKEACSFRDAFEELDTSGVTILGVSPDDEATHRRFADSHRLPFSLLTDSDGSLARAYGVRGFLGLFVQRVTYVIDREGTIRGAFRDELRAGRHLAEVRKCLETINS
jgi:thioredoxin-dependent peroxiredoxin